MDLEINIEPWYLIGNADMWKAEVAHKISKIGESLLNIVWYRANE